MAANFPSRAARTKVSLLRSDCHTSKSAFACWKQAKPNRLEVADCALLIAAKSSFQPAFELMKQELEVRSGRLLKQFDNARTQILPGVINCSEQTHIGPEVAVLLPAKDFFLIRQPIEIFTVSPSVIVPRKRRCSIDISPSI